MMISTFLCISIYFLLCIQNKNTLKSYRVNQSVFGKMSPQLQIIKQNKVKNQKYIENIKAN